MRVIRRCPLCALQRLVNAIRQIGLLVLLLAEAFMWQLHWDLRRRPGRIVFAVNGYFDVPVNGFVLRVEAVDAIDLVLELPRLCSGVQCVFTNRALGPRT